MVKIAAKLKIDSLIVIGIAILFQWFFMFTKHNARLRPVIPFRDDPYDALGSFATIVNIFLCLLLLWRTFRPYRSRTPSPTQIQYLRRTQAAVPLSIVVTLAADAVAMIRHPQMWMGTTSQNLLLTSFVGVTLVSGVALYSIKHSAQQPTASERRSATGSAEVIAVVFFLTLALYPERLIGPLATHLITIIIGDLLLFVPVSALLFLLLPDIEDSPGRTSKSRGPTYLWTGTILTGLVIGVGLFFAEMGEGGGPTPALRLRLIVAAVYIGLTVAGVLIAFIFLKRPLGLAQCSTAQSSS